MILGNSKGQNKGKKYFKEKNKNKNLCFPEKTKNFDDWFIANIRPLKVQLFGKYYHPTNEDVFNDTYLRIHERIYFTGFNIADYKSYFCRAFYTNHIQELMKNNHYTEIDFAESMGDDKDAECSESDLDKKFRQLEDEVFSYVYHRFDIHEFEIFKMYMRLKIQGKNMTYELLADIIRNEEYKVHNIQAIISKIKKEVARQFAEKWEAII
ncbi:hypothetical protein LJC00_03110 [Dysgonomonas sp. OttesenSCG-928-M03]|nr:hypothetical protein [Dysgonomonas sp. OttesenSCG-928-M03]